MQFNSEKVRYVIYLSKSNPNADNIIKIRYGYKKLYLLRFISNYFEVLYFSIHLVQSRPVSLLGSVEAGGQSEPRFLQL